MPHDVFISYSSKDKPVADAVCAAVEAVGVRCWIAPRDICPGSDWAPSIIDAINSSSLMLLVFSSNANTSQQITKEVERAVHKGLPMIPLRIEAVEPSKSLEYFISTPHWLDALTPPLEKHLTHVAETVRFLLARTRGEEGLQPARMRDKQESRQTFPMPPRRGSRQAIIWAAVAGVVLLGGVGAWLAERYIVGAGPKPLYVDGRSTTPLPANGGNAATASSLVPPAVNPLAVNPLADPINNTPVAPRITTPDPTPPVSPAPRPAQVQPVNPLVSQPQPTAPQAVNPLANQSQTTWFQPATTPPVTPTIIPPTPPAPAPPPPVDQAAVYRQVMWDAHLLPTGHARKKYEELGATLETTSSSSKDPEALVEKLRTFQQTLVHYRTEYGNSYPLQEKTNEDAVTGVLRILAEEHLEDWADASLGDAKVDLPTLYSDWRQNASKLGSTVGEIEARMRSIDAPGVKSSDDDLHNIAGWKSRVESNPLYGANGASADPRLKSALKTPLDQLDQLALALSIPADAWPEMRRQAANDHLCIAARYVAFKQLSLWKRTHIGAERLRGSDPDADQDIRSTLAAAIEQSDLLPTQKKAIERSFDSDKARDDRLKQGH